MRKDALRNNLATQPITEPRRLAFVSIIAIASVVLVSYFPSTKIAFFQDDYWYVESAARLGFLRDLLFFFDPSVQVMAYRPLLGTLIDVEYHLFQFNAGVYHVTQVFLHLANSLLLSSIVFHLTRNRRLGTVSAILFATFPAYSVAVFWPAVHDALALLLCLAALQVWIRYLETNSRFLYVTGICIFGLALLSKELAVTLPLVLIVVERVLLQNKIGLRAIMRRYFPFGLVLLPYLILQIQFQSKGAFVNLAGYSLGPHMLSNVLHYLQMLLLAWNWAPVFTANWIWKLPSMSVWTAILLVLFGAVIVWKKSRVFVFLATWAALSVLPISGFPPDSGDPRYLYFSAVSLAVVVGLVLEWIVAKWRKDWRRIVIAFAVGCIVLWNTFGVMEASAHFAEEARQDRVPFRDIVREHPTLPEDTLIFFVEPWMRMPFISGMFFAQYGDRVSVGGTSEEGTIYPLGKLSGKPANLRAHNNALVYYFDKTRRPVKVPVDKASQTESLPTIPATFQVPIQLEGYEITKSRVKPGETIVLILYWRATGRIERDYTVFVHLVDSEGRLVEAYDGQPRDGKDATSSWRANHFAADAHVITLPQEISPSHDYHLEIGLYYLPTLERVGIVNSEGHTFAGRISIFPIIVE